MKQFTHFDESGAAHMVDVGAKAVTQRTAVAEGVIRMEPDTLAMIVAGTHRKGDVLGIARIAGIMASKSTTGHTGVEMEALTAVQVALLTIYDMCKAMDRSMTMQDIRLLEKSGGKSGEWRRFDWSPV